MKANGGLLTTPISPIIISTPRAGGIELSWFWRRLVSAAQFWRRSCCGNVEHPGEFRFEEHGRGHALHVVAEAMKLAFADRAYWLGDPDFANVPRGLISKKYAAGLAEKINLQHTTAVPSHENRRMGRRICSKTHDAFFRGR